MCPLFGGHLFKKFVGSTLQTPSSTRKLRSVFKCFINTIHAGYIAGLIFFYLVRSESSYFYKGRIRSRFLRMDVFGLSLYKMVVSGTGFSNFRIRIPNLTQSEKNIKIGSGTVFLGWSDPDQIFLEIGSATLLLYHHLYGSWVVRGDVEAEPAISSQREALAQVRTCPTDPRQIRCEIKHILYLTII